MSFNIILWFDLMFVFFFYGIEPRSSGQSKTAVLYILLVRKMQLFLATAGKYYCYVEHWIHLKNIFKWFLLLSSVPFLLLVLNNCYLFHSLHCMNLVFPIIQVQKKPYC